MLDRTEPPGRKPRESRWQRRWTAIVDWLGAQKPLDLILGAVIIITVISTLARMG